MARVTVEDCLEHTEGAFSLVKLAASRARRIANGSETLLEDEENDKLQHKCLADLLDRTSAPLV